MATVTVTFSSAFHSPPRVLNAPIPVGSAARTEEIATATDGTGAGALVVQADENHARVLADADVWVAFGPSPSTAAATDGTRRAWKVKSGIADDFDVAEGDMVAVEVA